jgi:glucan biosynthesis protein
MSNKGYKSERLQYQLRFYVDFKKLKIAGDFPKEVAAKIATEEARRRFIATGKSIPGVRIVVRWRNPDNRNPRHADWKTTEDPDQSLFGLWKTLGQGRGALR